MNKINFLFFISIIFFGEIISQTSIDCFQGKFEGIVSLEPHRVDYAIFNGHNFISVSVVEKDTVVTLNKLVTLDSINIKQNMLSDNSHLFQDLSINWGFIPYVNIHDEGNIDYSEIIPWTYFSCDEDGLSFGNSRINDYQKVETLPEFVFRSIYLESLEDNYNYLPNFLSINIFSVCEDKVNIYDSVGGNLNGYLILGDLVEVLEKQGEWAKVRYLKTDIEYWTYASCLK